MTLQIKYNLWMTTAPVQAIVKSNGWSEGTAALQLFTHLDGEALNVALLMPVEEREKWEDQSFGVL